MEHRPLKRLGVKPKNVQTKKESADLHGVVFFFKLKFNFIIEILLVSGAEIQCVQYSSKSVGFSFFYLRNMSRFLILSSRRCYVHVICPPVFLGKVNHLRLIDLSLV